MYRDARVADVPVDDGDNDMNGIRRVHGRAEHLTAVPGQRADMRDSDGAVVLGKGFYARGAEELAPLILGKLLCRRYPDGTVRRYRVTETEAYCGVDDTACHAHRRPTGRASIMFSEGGLAYVHRCHMYNLLTVVAGPEGDAEGVLIRGLEGFDGPGRAGREIGLELSMYGSPMSPKGFLWLEDDRTVPEFTVHERIGIPYAFEEDRARLWRFRATGRRHY